MKYLGRSASHHPSGQGKTWPGARIIKDLKHFVRKNNACCDAVIWPFFVNRHPKLIREISNTSAGVAALNKLLAKIWRM